MLLLDLHVPFRVVGRAFNFGVQVVTRWLSRASELLIGRVRYQTGRIGPEHLKVALPFFLELKKTLLILLAIGVFLWCSGRDIGAVVVMKRWRAAVVLETKTGGR